MPGIGHASIIPASAPMAVCSAEVRDAPLTGCFSACCCAAMLPQIETQDVQRIKLI